MKIILSTEKIEDIQRKLLKSRNIPEVHDIVMTLPYFCFLSVDKKQNMDDIKHELLIFFSIFNIPLNIYAMHNEYFYEMEGINRLNFFDYFRNIVEKDKSKKLNTTKETQMFVDNIIKQIQENNFNDNDIVIIKQQRLG